MKIIRDLFCDFREASMLRLPYFGYNMVVGVFAVVLLMTISLMMGQGYNYAALLADHMMFNILYELFITYISFVLAVKRLRDMGAKYPMIWSAIFSVVWFAVGVLSVIPGASLVGTILLLWSLLIFVVLCVIPSGYLKK